MIIFIKKIKTKEGINSIDMEKIQKDIPAGYEAMGNEPIVSFTANHLLIAFKCQVKSKTSDNEKTKNNTTDNKKAKNKVKIKSKKIVVGKV